MHTNNGLLELNQEGHTWVDSMLGSLTLDQKVGQLMVFPHYGTFITPDVKDMIRLHHAGGLRIAQKFAPGTNDFRGRAASDWTAGTLFDRPKEMQRISCTAEEFAKTLNELRDMAMEHNGVPLHTAFDQEGEGADFLFEQRLYPFPMGLTASGDPDLAYRVARALGRQTRALGANMIHSPVLDVNTEPKNPEIGPRAYAADAETVAEYAAASLRGFTDAGIAATGKHFPGRGHSSSDAHFGLPEIDLDRETLMRKHVEPFRRLIQQGLPCIMAAFTAYPALGADGIPGATSKAIVTDLLRGELGFGGVVTTDNVQMGGLLSLYGMGEAVVRCLVAGCDLVLCRAYDHQRLEVLQAVKEAVRAGIYPEVQLDVSVKRILELRWKMGLAENGGKVDPAKAADAFYDPNVETLAVEAAERSTVLLRDRTEVLPLSKDKPLLLVEQIHHFHSFINNSYVHPGLLWEELCRHSDQVSVVAVNEKMTPEDYETLQARLAGADLVVCTSYYNYRSHACMIPALEAIRDSGKKLVVLANTPYRAFGVPDWVDTALVSFCPSGRENLQVAADILFGQRTATATLPVADL